MMLKLQIKVLSSEGAISLKIIFIILLSFSCLSYSGTKKTDIESLDKFYIIDEFRIFYTLEGEHALPTSNQIDLNDNKIPDYVENIGLKLKAASTLYIDTFGLTHPLAGKRYKNRASHIDVFILDMENKGNAGDGLVSYDYKALKNNGIKTLTIKLSNDLRKGSMTPAHELFHTFQNGYTMFKNIWYTEGTARWVEYAFKKGVGEYKLLPTKQEDLTNLVDTDYDAAYFWNRLTYLCDNNKGTLPLPDIAKQHIASYPYPFEDNSIYGYQFIKNFLEALEDMSKLASRDRKLELYDWPEDEQKKNKLNNAYIFCAVKKSVYKTCARQQIDTPEMTQFIKALDSYTTSRCDNDSKID